MVPVVDYWYELEPVYPISYPKVKTRLKITSVVVCLFRRKATEISTRGFCAFQTNMFLHPEYFIIKRGHAL